MPAPVRVAALVVTYDHAEEISACLDAALSQTSGGLSLEPVVVDNASSDGTPEVLARYADPAIVIAMEENTGFAAAVNRAFSASDAEWVLFLNPDVVMDEGCVQALLDHLRAHPQAATAAALLRDPDGGLQRFARRDPDLLAVAWTMTELGRRIDARGGGRRLRHRRYEEQWRAGVDRPIAVDCPAAACVLARRELLEPQPFDERFPLFFNDAELFRRLRAGGWRHDVVPAATAVHGYGTSVQRVDPARLRAEWVVAVRRYLRTELGPAGRIALTALLLADAVGSGLLHAIGRGTPRTPSEVRGTLGGLGLPGGARPWLSEPRT